MKIALIEPFYTGSHQAWAEGYMSHSKFVFDLFQMKGIYWKWRMHGGAVHLAKEFSNFYHTHDLPEAILTTDMLNLPVFLSLNRHLDIPIFTYFHENQITYPWSTQDRDVVKKRDHHYGFINYSTALASDTILFNSEFHRNSFINGLKKFLKKFPDHRGLDTITNIETKSIVSYLGMDLFLFDDYKKTPELNTPPTLLWNHRWEYDKNPIDFFRLIAILKSKDLEFRLIIVGEEFDTEMPTFTYARDQFSDIIIQFGYCDSFEEYAHYLWQADIIPVTSQQEFFGASVMEAVYCNTYPIVPDRLTYPELLNKNDNEHLFYHSFEELVDKTILAIQQINNTRSTKFRQLAKPFRWENMAEKYDLLIENRMR